jgi:ribosomal protein S18 acetylase RimI-like enzyme
MARQPAEGNNRRAGDRVVIVSLRPEVPDDGPFLKTLILATVSEELGADAWPRPMRDHLLNIQYQTRRSGIKTLFPGGSSRIIQMDGENAGWLFVSDLEDQIRIVEIMVLARYRGRGIGSTAIRDVLTAAAQTGKRVTLAVNAMNIRAFRLYERLGFRRTGGDEVQLQMEFRGVAPC